LSTDATKMRKEPVGSRVLPWLRGYDRAWLGSDLIAGATAAAVVIPQAMGYATVAGLPVEIGLYTCIFPMLVYAVVGGSRRLSFSTTSTIAALTGLALIQVEANSGSEALSAVATLTFLVGLTLIVFRVIGLGWLVESVSEATTAGLKLGIGLTIVADQLPKVLGIPPAEGGFFADLRNVVEMLPDSNGATFLLSVVTLAVLLAMRRWWPKFPGPLLALAGGIGLIVFTGISERGVSTIGEVPTGLPFPTFPSFPDVEALLPFALAIALMSYLESMTASRVARQSEDPPLDNNQEYVASGVAGVVGSLFQTMPAGGGMSQTQVNTNSGAKTQLSLLVTGALAVAVALFLAPVLSDLPNATLGVIVIFSVLGMLRLAELKRIGTIDSLELWVAGITAFFALAYNLLIGVIFGVILTLYFVLRTLNHPVVVELRRAPSSRELLPAREGDEAIPGMLILRIEGGLYTLNVREAQSRILEETAAADHPPDVVLLDAGGTADTSVTVIDVIGETDHMLERQGSTLWIANIPTRAEEKARRSELWDQWSGKGKIHATVAAAVASFEAARDAEL
jgi:high affinity sulfate transporter 1